jgi:glucokinase
VTVLALDIGGTTARGVLMSRDGQILARRTTPTGDRDPGLRATRRVAEHLAGLADDRGLTLTAVGAGFPEYVDPEGRLTAHEVLDWDRQPVELLADLAPTVVVESDVRCGALGELHRTGGTRRDFVYISLGTGLSYTLVCGGTIHRGARGEAIALGELPVPAEADADRTETMESFASGTGLARRYTERTGRHLTDGARSVVALAAEGDRAAGSILTSAGLALGHVCSQLTSLLDPEAIVLGGGLGTCPGVLHDAMLASYTRATVRRPSPPPIVTSALGADAGLVGAGHLAWSVAGQRGRR